MSINPLERRIKAVARGLHAFQVARLYKLPNDVKIIDGEMIFAEQVPCDFFGFTSSGRAILVECKMCKGDTLAVGDKKGVKPHQIQALREVQRAGGIGLLVWQRLLDLAVIDIDQVIAYSAGRKSITWSRIPEDFKKPAAIEDLQLFAPFL